MKFTIIKLGDPIKHFQINNLTEISMLNYLSLSSKFYANKKDIDSNLIDIKFFELIGLKIEDVTNDNFTRLVIKVLEHQERKRKANE